MDAPPRDDGAAGASAQEVASPSLSLKTQASGESAHKAKGGAEAAEKGVPDREAGADRARRRCADLHLLVSAHNTEMLLFSVSSLG